MTVAELIAVLAQANPDAQVHVINTEGHRGIVKLPKVTKAVDCGKSFLIETAEPYSGRGATARELACI